MRIGELAALTAVSERMLRYYEQQGLLRPSRTASGYRDYGDAEVVAARRIRTLNASGLKLDVIRTLLHCMREGPDPFMSCADTRSTLLGELHKLDQQLRDLQESRQIVQGYLDGLDPSEGAAQASTDANAKKAGR